eukprot:334684-Alexandrium_andersonii.AAC.1
MLVNGSARDAVSLRMETSSTARNKSWAGEPNKTHTARIVLHMRHLPRTSTMADTSGQGLNMEGPRYG